MWAYSYTWVRQPDTHNGEERTTDFEQSKYIVPTIVGTVKVTFNEATNQTAATTMFHSVRPSPKSGVLMTE